MSKTLVAVLAGNGNKCKYDDKKFEKCFWSNNEQDVVAFVDKNVHPNWNPVHFKTEHNGKPYINSVSDVASIRNHIIDWALNNGYRKMWMIDDNISRVCLFDHVTKEFVDSGQTLPYSKFPTLPKIEHAFGGMVGSNFMKNRILRKTEYCHMAPISFIYFDFDKLLKITNGVMPRYVTDELMWDDYDFFLQLLNYGIRPHTFIRYTAQKNTSQDARVLKGSISSAGDLKTIMMGYGLYKKWGSENTMAIRKVNMVDIVIRRGIKKMEPIVYRWRYDTLDNFLQDILDDNNTRYVRNSMKSKSDGFEWVNLIKTTSTKKFKFGV